MDKTPDFLLKEYETVRCEMDQAVNETRTLERYALVAAGAIWTWLVGKPQYAALKWLPALLVLFLAFRAVVLTIHVDFIANYLTKIEREFALPDGLGFEQQFKGQGTLKRLSAYFFLGLLFLLSVVIACAYRV